MKKLSIFILIIFFTTSIYAEQKITFVSVLDESVKPNQNLLYCPVFQVFWDQFCKEYLLGQNVFMYNPSLIVKRLNSKIFSKEALPQDRIFSYLVEGYKVKNIDFVIKEKNKEKFSDLPDLNMTFGPTDTIAYSLLYQTIEPQLGFYSKTSPMEFICPFIEQKRIVEKAFGFDPYKDDADWVNIKQIKILFYKDDTNFAIKFATKVEDEEVIMAKVPLEKTLKDTIDAIEKQNIQGQEGDLLKGDVLLFPELNFFYVFNNEEISNKVMTNRGMENYFFSKALTCVMFKMNNTTPLDSSLKQSSYITGNSRFTATEDIVSTRRFVFDGPFLLYIKKKGFTDPYLVLWVNDIELMKGEEKNVRTF